MISIRKLNLISLASVALVVCGCATNKTQAGARDQLLATDTAFSRMSQAHGPAEAFYYFMATNGLSLPDGEQPIHGREAIRQSLSSVTGTLRWNPVEAEAAASGEIGYTWGTYDYEGKDPAGQPKTGHGKYVTIWKRQSDGSWKAVVDCGNSNPAPY